MDINIHLIIIVVIAIFFYLHNKSTSNSMAQFIILFSVLGLFFLINYDIELVDYTKTQINSTNTQYEQTTITTDNLGSTSVLGALWLAYFWFLILGALGLFRDPPKNET